MKNQPGTMKNHDTGWESDHFSLRTRVHNWPFRCSDCSHESKQTMPWSSNDTCTTSKNCRMQKYCLVLNITWRKKYLVWIFSAATEARETTQASSNDTCTTSRGGSTTGCTTTSGEKIWGEKHYLVMWEIVNNRLYSNIRDTSTLSLTICNLYYLFYATTT